MMNRCVWWQKTAGLCTILPFWPELDHRCWWWLLQVVNNGRSYYRRNPTIECGNPTGSMGKSFSHTCIRPHKHMQITTIATAACQVALACYIISAETEGERRRTGREQDSLSHARLHGSASAACQAGSSRHVKHNGSLCALSSCCYIICREKGGCSLRMMNH